MPKPNKKRTGRRPRPTIRQIEELESALAKFRADRAAKESLIKRAVSASAIDGGRFTLVARSLQTARGLLASVLAGPRGVNLIRPSLVTEIRSFLGESEKPEDAAFTRDVLLEGLKAAGSDPARPTPPLTDRASKFYADAEKKAAA